MDASAYNMSFDKEQLSVLCANYDRRIDTLANENARLRELVRDMWPSYCYANSGCETFLTDEQDAAIRDRVRWLRVINK